MPPFDVLTLDLTTVLLLTLAAMLAGALNAIAGGGSFISFPALVAVGGLPPINANATSTVALWPGAVASAVGYRSELRAQPRVLVVLGIASLIGGVLGAWLLLSLEQDTFAAMVPYLLLIATLLFAFGGHVTAWLGQYVHLSETSTPMLVVVAFLQLIIAIYGGFFGGGLSILMLASLSLLGLDNIHTMNAIKTVLNVFINGVAVVIFIVSGAVAWLPALIMVAGSIAGGYGGAYYGRQLDPKLVKRFAILVGFAMSLYFFLA